MTRRLVLAASAAAPKPMPSVRFAAGDASVAAWSFGRPKIGGTAGVLGLGGAAAVQYQTRRFHGTWGPSSALWPELSLPTPSRSLSRSMSSCLSRSSSSPHRSGIRRYVCQFSFFSFASLLLASYQSLHPCRCLLPYSPQACLMVHTPFLLLCMI